jgi:hypothetical protein
MNVIEVWAVGQDVIDGTDKWNYYFELKRKGVKGILKVISTKEINDKLAEWFK